MNAIRQQVSRARRRLILQQLGHSLVWCLFAGLIVALIGWVVPKIRPVPVDVATWQTWWLVGSIAASVVAALLYTWFRAPSLAAAAAEVDQRFRLKERLSSSLALNPEDTDSEAGRALLADAERRAKQIEVSDRFELRPHRRGLLPLLPALLLVTLVFVPDAVDDSQQAKASAQPPEQVQVKKATEQLKKRLVQRRKAAEAKGLEDAGDLFKKLEAGIDKLQSKEGLDRKEALVGLNDLKKQLEERRNELGNREEMKRNLSSLKDLDQGPAEKVAKALQKGNFGEAQQELQKLAKKMQEGELTETEKKKLQEQMEKLQQKLQEAIDRHEQAKQQLAEQIEQAKREGRLDDAARMQQKLDQMKQQDRQMQQLQKMANGMGKAAQQMAQGDAKAAAGQLSDIADQLGDMQAQMDELGDLEMAMDQLMDAKESMRCSSCSGGGCSACQGFGMGFSDQFSQQDWAKGRGQGAGWRDEEESETGNYDSQVRDKPGKGKAIAVGIASGPNRKGMTREDIKDVVQTAINEDADPLENQALPRAERRHAKEYFDRLRSGT